MALTKKSKTWIGLATIGAAAVATTTVALIVNQPKAPNLTPIYDLQFNNQRIVKIDALTYQIVVNGQNLDQFANRTIERINIVGLNTKTDHSKQVQTISPLVFQANQLVTSFQLKQPINEDFMCQIQFQAYPTNGFEFDQQHLPSTTVYLNSWYFYTDPNLIKIMHMQPPITKDNKIFNFAINGQNLDQLENYQLESHIEVQLIAGGQIVNQPMTFAFIKNPTTNFQNQWYLQIKLAKALTINPNQQKNWFQFRLIKINPFNNLLGFETSFEAQPIVLDESNQFHVISEKSTFRHIENKITVGSQQNYYYYQANLAVTNTYWIKDLIAQGDFQVLPTINSYNQQLEIDLDSVKITDDQLSFIVKSNHFLNQNQQINLTFNPYYAFINPQSYQIYLDYQYQNPVINNAQLQPSSEQTNRYDLVLSGRHLRNLLWSKWNEQHLVKPQWQISPSVIKIVNPSGKIIYPFQHLNTNTSQVILTFFDPHDYQDPNNQDWTEPTIKTTLVIPNELKVEPNAFWTIPFSDFNPPFLTFAVDKQWIDPTLANQSNHQPTTFTIIPTGVYDNDFPNSSHLTNSDLSPEWIKTTLFNQARNYFYFEGQFPSDWNLINNLQITNRSFDEVNGTLTFNLTIKNAIDNQHDLVLDQPFRWSGFQKSKPAYEYQFKPINSQIDLQITKRDFTNQISDFSQWDQFLKTLVLRNWNQIFVLEAPALNPLWTWQDNLSIKNLTFKTQPNQKTQITFQLLLTNANSQGEHIRTTIVLNDIELAQPTISWKTDVNLHQLQLGPNQSTVDFDYFYQHYFNILFNTHNLSPTIPIQSLEKMVHLATTANNQLQVSITNYNPVTNQTSPNQANMRQFQLVPAQAQATPINVYHLKGDQSVDVNLKNFNNPFLIFYQATNLAKQIEINSFDATRYNKQIFELILNSALDQIFDNVQNEKINTKVYFGNQIGALQSQAPLLNITNISNQFNTNPQVPFMINVQVSDQLTIVNQKQQQLKNFQINLTWSDSTKVQEQLRQNPINFDQIIPHNTVSLKNVNWFNTEGQKITLMRYLKAYVSLALERFLFKQKIPYLSSLELLNFDQRLENNFQIDQANHSIKLNFSYYQPFNDQPLHLQKPVPITITFKDFKTTQWNEKLPTTSYPIMPNRLNFTTHDLLWTISHLQQGWFDLIFPVVTNVIDPDGTYISTETTFEIAKIDLIMEITSSNQDPTLSSFSLKTRNFYQHSSPEAHNFNSFTTKPTTNLKQFQNQQQQHFFDQIWSAQINNSQFNNYQSDPFHLGAWWLNLITNNQIALQDYWWALNLKFVRAGAELRPVFWINQRFEKHNQIWTSKNFISEVDFSRSEARYQPINFQIPDQNISLAAIDLYQIYQLGWNYDWLIKSLWNHSNQLYVNRPDLIPNNSSFQQFELWFKSQYDLAIPFNQLWINNNQIKLTNKNNQASIISFSKRLDQGLTFVKNNTFQPNSFNQKYATLNQLIEANFNLFFVNQNPNNLALWNQINSTLYTTKVLEDTDQHIKWTINLTTTQFSPQKGFTNQNLKQTFTIYKATTIEAPWVFINNEPTIVHRFATTQAISDFDNVSSLKQWLVLNYQNWFVSPSQLPSQTLFKYLDISAIKVSENRQIEFKLTLTSPHLNQVAKNVILTNLAPMQYQFGFKTNTIALNKFNSLNQLKTALILNSQQWLSASGTIPLMFNYQKYLVINHIKQINLQKYQVQITLYNANHLHQSISQNFDIIITN